LGSFFDRSEFRTPVFFRPFIGAVLQRASEIQNVDVTNVRQYLAGVSASPFSQVESSDIVVAAFASGPTTRIAIIGEDISPVIA